MKAKLAEILEKIDGKKIRSLVGFDGFIDEVVHVVDKRYGPEEFDRVLTIAEYGKRISRGAGLSTNVEIVPIVKKLGGNGPIFALGLKKYGIGLTYIGCTGETAIEPVFCELAEGSNVYGIADPGQTDAMEFEDGKIIRSKLTSLNKANWDSIVSRVGLGQFIHIMNESDLISFNNWTMLPYMSDIWKHILAEVVPKMSVDLKGKTIFFDLADPEKRTKEDVLEALRLLKQFKAAGFKTALGLNRKEACEIAEIIGKEIPDIRAVPLKSLTFYIAKYLAIDCLVIHPTECAACIADGQYYEVEGPFCPKPKLTTGAGDNFNAGFVFGYVNGLPPDLCLLFGTASSGFYVRNSRSADIGEICSFLRNWETGILD